MADATILDIIIRAKNETGSGLTKATSDMSGLRKAATVTAAAGAAALIGIGVYAIKSAADFQTLTTRLVTTAGESAKNLTMVQNGILGISSSTGLAANDIDQGMYQIESAGYHGAAGLTVLKAAAQASAMEGGNMVDVSKILSATLRDYHLPASQAANVTSKLIEATSQGQMTFQQLASSLHSVSPLAQVAGISLNDLLGAVAGMTVHGMSADQATQDLAHSIQKLQNPTQIMTSEMANIGINSSQLNGMLGKKGLTGTMEYLSQTVLQKMGP
ncbi:MAG: phage tail tape measure protein, partial [Candidatus Micrarchaeaceae archaeon]